MNWNITYAQGDSLSDIYLTSGQLPEVLYDMRTDVFTVNEHGERQSVDGLLPIFRQHGALRLDAPARHDDHLRLCVPQGRGHVCGRQWTVWYAPGIPIGIGPWKLNGLPGLIVRADDADGTHHMELVAAQKADGEVMDYAVQGRIKMTRERFLKKERRFCTQGDTYVSDVPLPFRDGGGGELPKARRRFYAPYELE